MKQLLLLLLIPLAVFSQQRDSVVNNGKVFYYGEYYVDSVWVDLKKTFLDYDNIQEIAQFKNPEPFSTRQPGAILFTRKKKTPVVRLDSFMKSSESLKDKHRVNIIVNGVLVEHPEEYFIEETAITKTEITEYTSKIYDNQPDGIPCIIITLKKPKTAN